MSFLKKRKAPIKCFTQETRQTLLANPIDRGMRPVDIEKIVGSVDRCTDFYEKFVPKKRFKASNPRLQKIKSIMEERKELPVIELYKVKDEYYVLDGHHRVVAAKDIGRKSIDAHIVEYLPTGESIENRLLREKTFFEVKTKLEDINLTQNDSYNILLKEIENFQNRLQKKEEIASIEDAARRWHESIYQPSIKEIEDSNLLRFFSGLTKGDLYACIIRHQERRFMKRYNRSSERITNDDDFRRYIRVLYSVIEKDRNLKSEATIQQLQKILPPCLYLKFCPRWPEDEPRERLTYIERIKKIMSAALTTIKASD